MVISCVAYGCSNEQNPRKIPFHTFPFKRPEILKLWIQALGRDNWTPSKTSRICGEHFLSSDYIRKPFLTANLLKPDAVPSIFAFSAKTVSPQCLLPKPTAPCITVVEQVEQITSEIKIENELMEADLSSTFAASPESTTAPAASMQYPLLDKEVQFLEIKVARLHREVKTLRQKIKRRDETIRNLKLAFCIENRMKRSQE